MIYFDHYGRNPSSENRPRQLLVTVLLVVAAIALFPFTILGLFLWGLWFLLSQPPGRLSFR
jgi:hypothetical protein